MAIDHYGKMVDAGTRGSSNKEGSTDTVLASLAERETNGSVGNTRLAIRKQRDGLSGFEVSFIPKTTEVGIDEDGDPETTVTIEWGAEQMSMKMKTLSKAVRLLQQVIKAVLADHGFQAQLPGGDTIEAAHLSEVRAEFETRHVVAGAGNIKDSRQKAFRRALDDAVLAEVVGVREVLGLEIVWLMTP